jgi:D-alanyl-D-alanine carboxypeptidase (penicillin-binding protein 5/6)
MPMLLTGLAVSVAFAFAVVIPVGLPYDEPSHWLNVLHIARDWTLPRIGDPDVSYEAQQAPLAYYVGAAVYTLAGGGTVGFYVVRVSGVVWLGLCAVASHRLVAAAFPRLGDTAWLGVAVAYGNPMLLACAMSVQNDVPALAIALWGLERAGKQKPVAAGVLVGLACLTKLPAVAVLVGVVILLDRMESRPLG